MGGKLVHLNGTSGGYTGPDRPMRYPPGLREKAVGLARAGMPKKDIALRLGVHVSSVKEWCRRAEVALREDEPDRLREFPAWVRARRAARGWTQRELSARSGVPSSTIANIEVGRFGATLRTAVSIMDALEADG